MRTGALLLLAWLPGCVTTALKPCAEDPSVCGPDAYCNPDTQLCERMQPDMAQAPSPPDMAVCNVNFTNGPAQPLPSGANGDFLLIADLNKDKYGDYISVDASNNKLNVFLSMGSNGYAPVKQYGLDANPKGVVVADLNGDGTLDIAVMSSSGTPGTQLGLLTNSSANPGTLSNKSVIYSNSGAQHTDLIVGKFSGAPYPDLVSINTTNNQLSRFTFDGTKFNQTSVGLTGNGNAMGLGAGNLDGDAFDDVVMVRKTSGNTYLMTVRWGAMGGASLMTQSDTVPSATALANQPTVADINHDGKADVMGIENSTSIHTWFGQAGQVAPSDLGKMTLSVGSNLNQLVTADFNQDGIKDLLAMGRNTANVYLFNGTATGLNTTPMSIPVGMVQNNTIAAGDVNNDGLPEFTIDKNTNPETIFQLFNKCQ